jgi:hypothetical protein
VQASSQAVERAISLSTAREAVRQPISMDALLHQVADADSPARSARRWPRRIFPMPFRAGAHDCFDENRRSHAEGGTGRRNKTPALPRRHREGDRGRVRASLARRTARGRHHDEAIWHSAGRKVAGDTSLWKCCNPDTSGGKWRRSLAIAPIKGHRYDRFPCRTSDTFLSRKCPQMGSSVLALNGRR